MHNFHYKYKILTEKIWQLSIVHTVFFLSVAVELPSLLSARMYILFLILKERFCELRVESNHQISQTYPFKFSQNNESHFTLCALYV